MAAKTKDGAAEALKQLSYLGSALKAPRIIEAAVRLADHARDAGWTLGTGLRLDWSAASLSASVIKSKVGTASSGTCTADDRRGDTVKNPGSTPRASHMPSHRRDAGECLRSIEAP